MIEELTPRERRHHRTQQAILVAAMELIREKGVDGLSIRAIADKIDYSAAGLYEYYGSKEEIIAALCLQGFHHFAQTLASVDKTLPADEYMTELGLAYINFAIQNSDFFLLMFTTAPLLFPNFRNENTPNAEQLWREDDAFSILVQGIERCVHEGFFAPRSDFGVLELARVSWSMVHGIAMLQLSLMRNIPFEEAKARVTLGLLFAGMKTL